MRSYKNRSYNREGNSPYAFDVSRTIFPGDTVAAERSRRPDSLGR